MSIGLLDRFIRVLEFSKALILLTAVCIQESAHIVLKLNKQPLFSNEKAVDSAY